MTTQSEIILHHYPASPYSEKVRLFLGFKQIDWLSVITPATLPKPDLTILTGGYRRAPVLQIGSDLFCDSTLILETLDRLFPKPELSTEHQNSFTAKVLGQYVDTEVFLKVARFVMGSYAQKLPQELVDDRAAMQPNLKLSRKDIESEVPYLNLSLSKLLPELGGVLGEKLYFGGETPAAGDFAIYHPFWFLNTIRKFKPMVPKNENLHNWFARMKEFGHGNSTLLSAEDALSRALATSPKFLETQTEAIDGFMLGQNITVHPENYEHEKIFGRLASIDSSQIILSHETEKTGIVHVHLPRLRYLVQPA
ncbi:glutathione S-transferase family protein [Leptospira sp. WS92.C1]